MNIFDILQLILSIVIIFLILLQQRGTEGGVLFGGRTEFFLKRRGLDKNIYYITWILIIIFIGISLLRVIGK
ncbi:MAG: preprotein translocase subunit SecG [Patescibacteria group bacterium]|nr:preprotein translocase subunit SecG [Patescibacteria group bacterium]